MDDGLVVVDVNGEVTGFLAHDGVEPLVVEVHPDHRGRGYGRQLAEHAVGLWPGEPVNILAVRQSVPFWLRMGFVVLPGEGDPFGSERMVNEPARR